MLVSCERRTSSAKASSAVTRRACMMIPFACPIRSRLSKARSRFARPRDSESVMAARTASTRATDSVTSLKARGVSA